MKKLLTLLVCLLMLLSLSACGLSFGTTVETADQNAVIDNDGTSGEDQAEEQKEVKAGEKLVTDTMEITINSVELTYDVLPDDTSGFYTHYQADAGKVYISIDATVFNKAKQNLPCDEIGKVTADYNDGYTYKGFAIVKDPSTGFTYANITNVDPLESLGIKWLIECPQEVDETENPLFVLFTVQGEEFVYHIR